MLLLSLTAATLSACLHLHLRLRLPLCALPHICGTPAGLLPCSLMPTHRLTAYVHQHQREPALAHARSQERRPIILDHALVKLATGKQHAPLPLAVPARDHGAVQCRAARTARLCGAPGTMRARRRPCTACLQHRVSAPADLGVVHACMQADWEAREVSIRQCTWEHEARASRLTLCSSQMRCVQ